MAKRKHGLLFLLPVMAGIAFAAPAAAEDDTDNFALSPEQLFQADVVSVSRTTEKVMDAAAAIFVLTNEDIRRSGATSVPEALRLVPGMDVEQVNANSWAISVRGFNGTLANKLLVLIDGREVYDPLFAGVYWDLQDLMLEDIDHIEVVRGPGGSLWGANAVNGVINIITKKAEDTQGGLLGETAGSQPRSITTARYGGKLGDDGYYRVYGKFSDRADEETLAGDAAHDGQVDGRGGFRADWKGGEHDSFTMQGDVYRSNDGNLRSLPTFTSPFAQTVQEDIKARGLNVLGRWNREFSEDSKFTLQTYVNYDKRDQIIINDERTTFDMDAQYELPTWTGNKVIAGAGYRYSSDILTASPYASFTGDGDRTDIFSAFVQDRITLEPKTLFLTVGTKVEYNDFTGVEWQPNVRLQWSPDETQTFWASVARAIRRPDRIEHDLTINEGVLNFGGIPAELLLVPNVDFESERLTAYEVGYRNQLTPRLLVDNTVFYNDYDELGTISFLPNFTLSLTPPVHFTFPITTTNSTGGNAVGTEHTVSWRALDNLNLSASYSFMVMDLDGPPSTAAINAEASEKTSPSQQFNLRIQWDVIDNISFDTMLYYTSSLTGYQVPEYVGLDARLGWKILDGLEFSLVGKNLAQSEHREFSSPTDVAAVQIGRSVYGNFTWRF